MSKSSRLKRKVGYDHNPPVCRSCIHYKKPFGRLENSLPVAGHPPMCGLHTFIVKPTAVCDNWRGKDGTFLED